MTIFNSVYKSFEQWWQLGANTVAYYPFNWDILDHKSDYGVSGTDYDLTAVFWTPSYTTSFDSSKQAFNPQATNNTSWWCWLQNSNSVWNFSWDFTVSFCVKLNQSFNNYTSFITNRYRWDFRFMNSIDGNNKFFFHGSAQYLTDTVLSVWTWYNITCTVLNWDYTIYIDWTAVKTGTYSYTSVNPSVLNIWFGYYDSSNYLERLNGCISEVIIDWEWWDATKAMDRAIYLWFASA